LATAAHPMTQTAGSIHMAEDTEKETLFFPRIRGRKGTSRLVRTSLRHRDRKKDVRPDVDEGLAEWEAEQQETQHEY